MSRSRLKLHGIVLAVSGLLLLAGCSDRYDEGFENGRKAGKAEGLKEGYTAGMEEGRAEGQLKGSQRAEEAAARGTALRLYLKPSFFSCAGGVAIGVGLQYILLYIFRRNSHLPWIGVTLVPGLADSRCFRLQSRLGVLALEEKRKLAEVRTRTEIRNAQIESIKIATQKTIEAKSDLETALLRNILKEADRKMQRIIEDAEKRKSTPTTPTSSRKGALRIGARRGGERKD